MSRGARRTASWSAAAIAAVLGVAGLASAGIFDDWGNGAVGYEAALRRRERSGQPVFIYFYADWCPNCRHLDNTVLATATVRRTLSEFAKVRINPERGQRERQLARQFRINGYPSLFIIPAGESAPRALGRIPTAPESFAQACAALRGTPLVRAASSAAPGEQAGGPAPGGVTVVLKNGSRVTGQLVLQDDQEIVVLADGVVRTVERSAVDRIIEEPSR